VKQNELVKKMYEASLSHSKDKTIELRKTEIQKILERRAQGKTKFKPKWIVTDL